MRSLPFVVLLAAACATPSAGIPRVYPPPPPQVAHVEGRFAGVGGTSLFWQAWKPAAAPGKAVLVVMHGLKDHSTRYADVAAELVKRGIAVYAFDLRGHGRSEGDRVWVEKFDDYLEDLGTFLDRVRKEEPGKPLFLFGHSMGGAIVTLYTLTREPYIQGLVLSAPAIHVDVAGVVSGSTKALGSVFSGLPVLSLDAADFSRDPATVEDQRTDPLIYQPSGPARTAAELFRSMDRIDALADELTVPLLLMHGSADKVTDPHGSQSLYDRAKSKDKTIKLYPGLYHDILHEPEKAQVTADFVSWVDARSHF
jgi:acylglycerol lipase